MKMKEKEIQKVVAKEIAYITILDILGNEKSKVVKSRKEIERIWIEIQKRVSKHSTGVWDDKEGKAHLISVRFGAVQYMVHWYEH